jgi:hypothetical protein
MPKKLFLELETSNFASSHAGFYLKYAVLGVKMSS